MSQAPTVEWRDGTPHSPRFQDIYHSCAGGLAQARQVFMQGCGLLQAWQQQSQWRVLETGFGLGLNFLATWQAWRDDPQRPTLLHFVSVEAHPVTVADLLRSAQDWSELAPLAQELSLQWQNLGPGFHRMSFEAGRVLLTLCIGDVKPMLRDLAFFADSVFLDGFSPAHNPDMWDEHTLKAVSRCCRRGTRVATWTVAREIRDRLTQCGFVLTMVPGLPPKRDRLEGEFNPAWEPKVRAAATSQVAAEPGDCVVIGSGLAGAAVANSLARRGWRVHVLDAGAEPAAGASGLPAGLVVPHISADDAVLSRLSRAGVAMTWQQVHRLLREGQDFALSGVRERRLEDDAPDLWHALAGWIKPAQLVKALLAQPGITWQGQMQVQCLRRQGENWLVLDAQDHVLAEAPRVIVCAGFGSLPLLQKELPLQALRGQLSWGWRGAADSDSFPATPVNGRGNFIPRVPTDLGLAWYLGSSFERDSTDTRPRDSDHQSNYAKLQTLLPETARALAPQFERAQVQSFTAVRCTTPDRLPVVGPVDATHLPGLWLSTAMGARGLTLALLSGELLAAQWHGEPLPVERKLAQALMPERKSLTPKREADPLCKL